MFIIEISWRSDKIKCWKLKIICKIWLVKRIIKIREKQFAWHFRNEFII